MWNPNRRAGYAAANPYVTGNAVPQQTAPVPTQNPQQLQQPQRTGAPAPQNASRHPAPGTQTAPARTPQPNQPSAAPQRQSNDPQPSADNYIDGKITKVNAKDKVMDLSDALVKALPKDYANIHGVGGKDHAPNSGIRLTLCDYSKGTGDASVTVKFIIDVRDIDYLQCIASSALNGTLGLKEQMRSVREFGTANGICIGWMQSNHQPTLQEVAQLQQIICNGLVAQDPDNAVDRILWSWSVQKNNPHKSACEWINGVEYTPVSSMNLSFNPSRKYPWTIRVANYKAPIIRQKNGASSHDNSKAIEKREVAFPITSADFFYALSDASHYIHLWEYRMFSTVNAMCNERERRAEAARQTKAQNR